MSDSFSRDWRLDFAASMGSSGDGRSSTRASNANTNSSSSSSNASRLPPILPPLPSRIPSPPARPPFIWDDMKMNLSDRRKAASPSIPIFNSSSTATATTSATTSTRSLFDLHRRRDVSSLRFLPHAAAGITQPPLLDNDAAARTTLTSFLQPSSSSTSSSTTSAAHDDAVASSPATFDFVSPETRRAVTSLAAAVEELKERVRQYRDRMERTEDRRQHADTTSSAATDPIGNTNPDACHAVNTRSEAEGKQREAKAKETKGKDCGDGGMKEGDRVEQRQDGMDARQAMAATIKAHNEALDVQLKTLQRVETLADVVTRLFEKTHRINSVHWARILALERRIESLCTMQKQFEDLNNDITRMEAHQQTLQATVSQCLSLLSGQGCMIDELRQEMKRQAEEITGLRAEVKHLDPQTQTNNVNDDSNSNTNSNASADVDVEIDAAASSDSACTSHLHVAAAVTDRLDSPDHDHDHAITHQDEDEDGERERERERVMDGLEQEYEYDHDQEYDDEYECVQMENEDFLFAENNPDRH